jgi:hypothetical protein
VQRADSSTKIEEIYPSYLHAVKQRVINYLLKLKQSAQTNVTYASQAAELEAPMFKLNSLIV